MIGEHHPRRELFLVQAGQTPSRWRRAAVGRRPAHRHPAAPGLSAAERARERAGSARRRSSPRSTSLPDGEVRAVIRSGDDARDADRHAARPAGRVVSTRRRHQRLGDRRLHPRRHRDIVRPRRLRARGRGQTVQPVARRSSGAASPASGACCSAGRRAIRASASCWVCSIRASATASPPPISRDIDHEHREHLRADLDAAARRCEARAGEAARARTRERSCARCRPSIRSAAPCS